MTPIHFFLALFIPVFLAYLFVQRKFRYWKDRGVPYIEPRFPSGTVRLGNKRLHSSKVNKVYYDRLKGQFPFCGIFFFVQPSVLVLDLDLVKNILVKDFQYFHDRGVFFNEKDDPLSGHLFNLEGQRWRQLRAKLTPTFTSGKMKFMFPTVVEVGRQFQETLAAEAKTNAEVEIKELLARFTTDVIGQVAFGLECNSLKDPNAEFREMGKKVFEAPRNGRVKALLLITFKKLGRFLHIKSVRDDVTKFFMGAVKETVAYREQNKTQRNDFMDLLLKLKNEEKDGMTIEQIAAQAFVFFLAGFETSSTAMSYALYELSLNTELQEKARKCVNDVLSKYNGEWTYEAVNEMAYIEWCINESLRKYPPGAALIREATQDYLVPETKAIIEKGTIVIIPVYAIQHDPEFYPEPEKYQPERFSPEETTKRNPYTFIPFGEGPRICIGLRFGMMQAKIGLAMLLKNFRFTLSDKTPVPLEFSVKNVVLTPEGGLWLNVERL